MIEIENDIVIFQIIFKLFLVVEYYMPLKPAERWIFEQSLYHPFLFRYVIRPQLYKRNSNDPEKVHEYVLELLGEVDVCKTLAKNRYFFDAPWLKIRLNDKWIKPIGTAAGLDKNGDALEPFSDVYGFQEPGTVIISRREGNERPRVAVDNKSNDLYNAQGFPSKGMGHFIEKINAFRRFYTLYPIYVSVCGLPLSEENAVEQAMADMEILLQELNPYVDGFVWNPFSPNTAALTKLREPKIFRETAELMKKHASDKLRLVKMGPYDDKKREHLDLINGFLEGGGHGAVVVNTKMFPKDKLPVSDWRYPSAGRSGAFLKPYRLRAVQETREAFPEAVIFATGGIFDGDDAYETFKAGATALESYTPETFYGLGLVAKKQKRILKRLEAEGYSSMTELQRTVRKGKKLLCNQ